jgi:trans-aconitate methyltransferase
MDVIPFNPRRFESAAATYLDGRPAYSLKLFARIAQLCGLERSHALLDLGCGPGQIAIALAPYVGRILGVDPEPEMLKRATENATRAGASIEFIQGSSYDLSPALGTFQLVTMGRSFHWMDRVDTLRRLDGMISAGGTIALLRDDHPDVPDNAWHVPYRELLKRYSDGDVAKSVRSQMLSHDAILLGSPFSNLESIAVTERRTVTIDSLIQRAHTMSSTTALRLGERAAQLDTELRELLAQISPTGVLPEIVSSCALLARRAGHESS